MTEDVKAYFAKEYEKSNFRVVPGHWPDFKSKQEVDKWINFHEKGSEFALQFFEEKEDDEMEFIPCKKCIYANQESMLCTNADAQRYDSPWHYSMACSDGVLKVNPLIQEKIGAANDRY